MGGRYYMVITNTLVIMLGGRWGKLSLLPLAGKSAYETTLGWDAADLIVYGCCSQNLSPVSIQKLKHERALLGLQH